MAILLNEEGMEGRYRMYATDINEAVLHTAEEGVMPLSEMQRFTRNYQLSGGTTSFANYYTARRKDAIFTTQQVGSAFGTELDAQLGGTQLSGVSVAGISVDMRDPEKRYMPGHPDADANGYVSMPRVNPAEDMVDLVSANRSYQANVAAMSAVKDMITKSIDLLK